MWEPADALTHSSVHSCKLERQGLQFWKQIPHMPLWDALRYCRKQYYHIHTTNIVWFFFRCSLRYPQWAHALSSSAMRSNSLSLALGHQGEVHGHCCTKGNALIRAWLPAEYFRSFCYHFAELKNFLPQKIWGLMHTQAAYISLALCSTICILPWWHSRMFCSVRTGFASPRAWTTLKHGALHAIYTSVGATLFICGFCSVWPSQDQRYSTKFFGYSGAPTMHPIPCCDTNFIMN